jgi:UDP-N-acetylglucosamine 2-epimerase (non-hydrolysing)
MSDVFFDDLDIPEPDWNMGVGSGTHAVQTGTAMMRLEDLLYDERPDAVMVVGDVNSTLAGALAAAKLSIPVIHLEAGLRSKDMSMPEEVNRLVTDQLSAMLLAPTEDALENLAREGVDKGRVHFVGNIMVESVLRNLDRIGDREPCKDYELEPNEYVLATIHRPENTDAPMRLANIVSAFVDAPLPVLMPVHPRTRPLLAAAGAFPTTPNLVLVDPVGYLDMIALERDARVVVTDSGGIQEETCVLHTPCVTVRRNTERWVTLDVGANRLVPAERDAVLDTIVTAMECKRSWPRPPRWDELVSKRVVKALDEGIIPLLGTGDDAA